MTADDMLSQLELEQYHDGDEAMAMLALALGAINREIEAKGADTQRIREWVRRLRETASKVANDVRADSFSISVGLPLGVSISVGWNL